MQDNATNCERRHGDQPTGSSTAVLLLSLLSTRIAKRNTPITMFARNALRTVKKNNQCRTFVSKTAARLAGPEKQLPGQPQNAMKKMVGLQHAYEQTNYEDLVSIPNRPRRPFVQRYGKEPAKESYRELA